MSRPGEEGRGLGCRSIFVEEMTQGAVEERVRLVTGICDTPLLRLMVITVL